MYLSVNTPALLRDIRARLTTSKAFPSSITPTSLCLAAGIRADVRASQSVRDGAPREKSCSRASPVRPAMAAPIRLCETPSHGPHRQVLRQASLRTDSALLANAFRVSLGVQRARLSWVGTPRCGAVSLTHFVRTLCMCAKMAAIVRTLPGGWAFQTEGSRFMMRIWFRRSLTAKMRTAALASSASTLCRRAVTD